MNYAEAVAWLRSSQPRGIHLGLEVIGRLLAALEIPTGGDDFGPRFLHVAGTNGKGSVCALLDAICRAGGHRTGLYTSPALRSFREQIRLDGEWISREAAARGLTRLRQATEEWVDAPTLFELTTALALDHFAREGADLVILETGLGGRLDATNVVTPIVSVLTPIDLDHQEYLGSTLGAIAAEKAGIIKPFIPVISAPQRPEVQRVLERRAHEQGTTLHLVASPLAPETPLALPGSHQRWNAALAIHALDTAGLDFPVAAIEEGLRTVVWPGRFQTLGRHTLDGAHNPAAARILAQTWREIFGEHERPTLILGVLADKDVTGICRELAPLAQRVITVPVKNSRALPAADLARHVRAVAPEAPCEVAASVAGALLRAREFPERILIGGSLYLVGEALPHLDSPGAEGPASPAA